MRLLGKLGILFLLLTSLYSAKLRVSNTQIAAGESVTFEISAEGKDIEFPDISDIGGYEVRQAGSSMKTANINGKITLQKSQSYTFEPLKSVTIPPFTVKIDGRYTQTKEQKIKIVSQEEINKHQPYKLSLHVSEKNPYVGQMIKLDVILKLNERLPVAKLGGLEIKGIKNFEENGKPAQTQRNENGYNIIKLSSFITPTNEGNLTLQGAIKLWFRSPNQDPFASFFNEYNYQLARSIPLHVDVKPLPNGAKVAGDFNIEVIADKHKVEAGRPVNIVVKVQGNGTLQELESLKPNIQDVVIYEDKPKISSNVYNGIMQSKWTQKMALIGSHDFTIPPFSLTFFDSKTKQIKTIKTQPIKINVKGEVQKSIATDKSEIITPIKEKIIIKKVGTNPLYMYVTFFAGLMLGFIIAKLDFKRFLPQKVKIFKNDKELLKEMLALKGKDKTLDNYIEKLEQNIYENQKHKINKKEINSLIKTLKS